MPGTILISLKTLATGRTTVDQLKYWAKLVGIKTKVVGRQAHVGADEAEILREIARKVEDGEAPSVAAASVGNSLAVKPTQSADEVEAVKPSEVENALLAVAKESAAIRADLSVIRGENQGLRGMLESLMKENQVLRSELAAIRSDVAVVNQLLLPTPGESQTVKPWQPVRLRPALSWYERIWYHVVDPTRLRAVEC